jgi:hypothetical protein
MANQVELNAPCEFCGINVRFVARSKAEAKRLQDAYVVCHAPDCEAKHQERIRIVVAKALEDNPL